MKEEKKDKWAINGGNMESIKFMAKDTNVTTTTTDWPITNTFKKRKKKHVVFYNIFNKCSQVNQMVIIHYIQKRDS